MWGCRFHWYQLPIRFRNAIMAAYRPGQELNKNPSPAYIEAAKAAREWIGKQRTHPWRQRQNNGGKL